MKATRSPALIIRDVTKRYGDSVAVRSASLELDPGRITCLLGPSGCGKSTLLRIVAGLERADEGEIEAGGKLLEGQGMALLPEIRGIGLVFQDFALFSHLNALDNVAFGLKRLPVAERRQRASALLDQFHLSHRANAWPHSLSGGEQQRVAIARALAPEPMAILLDEPFSGLDGDLRAQVRDSVFSGLRESDAAVLLVTHDPEEAMLLGDKLALMSEGRIVQSGTPDECYLRPNTAAAARLLGRANLLPATVSAGIAECAFGRFPADKVPDGPATAMLRPEALFPGPQGIAAEVLDVRFGGAWYETRLQANGETAVMRVTDTPPSPGETVMVSLRPDRATAISEDE